MKTCFSECPGSSYRGLHACTHLKWELTFPSISNWMCTSNRQLHMNMAVCDHCTMNPDLSWGLVNASVSSLRTSSYDHKRQASICQHKELNCHTIQLCQAKSIRTWPELIACCLLHTTQQRIALPFNNTIWTCRLRGDSILDEARELLFVSLLILLHQITHVLWHVDAHDVLAVDLCIELFTFWVISRETLGAGGIGKKMLKILNELLVGKL